MNRTERRITRRWPRRRRKTLKVVTLQLTVRFNGDVTDGESLCSALDTLLETAMSTPGILDEYDNPKVSGFEIAIEEEPS